MSIKKMDGKEVIEVSKDSSLKKDDQPTFVKIAGSHFADGIIEVNVLSRLLKKCTR